MPLYQLSLVVYSYAEWGICRRIQIKIITKNNKNTKNKKSKSVLVRSKSCENHLKKKTKKISPESQNRPHHTHITTFSPTTVIYSNNRDPTITSGLPHCLVFKVFHCRIWMQMQEPCLLCRLCAYMQFDFQCAARAISE